MSSTLARSAACGVFSQQGPTTRSASLKARTAFSSSKSTKVLRRTKFGEQRAERITVSAQELRDGDLGENAGESFFPTSETEQNCNGEEIPTEPMMRLGHGWDIHRLASVEEAGQGCVIGGIKIPDFDKGTIAHSDGDVLYHSATDALLGALGLPDIGQLFPDNDPRWRGADSEAFFDEAVRLMQLRGYRIMTMDVTLILQQPRVAKFKPAMKDNVVRICKTIPARVNIKARTHEKLDSIGEGRALSCHTYVMMERC